MGRESELHYGLSSTQFPHDRGMVPVGVEDSSEAAWREYDACCEALDRRLGQLRAGASAQARQAIRRAAAGRALEASLHLELLQAPPDATPPAAAAPHADATVEEVLRLARSHGRICPRPGPWRALFVLISRRGDLCAPSPVGAGDWNQTPDLSKQRILRDQIEWAHRHRVLHRFAGGLAALAEDDWHYLPALAWPALAITA